jgi:hypothetical protein
MPSTGGIPEVEVDDWSEFEDAVRGRLDAREFVVRTFEIERDVLIVPDGSFVGPVRDKWNHAGEVDQLRLDA